MSLEAKTDEHIRLSLDKEDMQLIAIWVNDTISSNPKNNGIKYATKEQVISNLLQNKVYKSEEEAIRAVMISAACLKEYGIDIKQKNDMIYFVMR